MESRTANSVPGTRCWASSLGSIRGRFVSLAGDTTTRAPSRDESKILLTRIPTSLTPTRHSETTIPSSLTQLVSVDN